MLNLQASKLRILRRCPLRMDLSIPLPPSGGSPPAVPAWQRTVFRPTCLSKPLRNELLTSTPTFHAFQPTFLNNFTNILQLRNHPEPPGAIFLFCNVFSRPSGTENDAQFGQNCKKNALFLFLLGVDLEAAIKPFWCAFGSSWDLFGASWRYVAGPKVMSPNGGPFLFKVYA